MLLADHSMAVLQLHVAISQSQRTGFYGRWLGNYPTGQQVIEIEQRAFMLLAWKVTGDPFVRPGEVTWVVFLDDMQAYGIVALKGSKDLSAVRGRITGIDRSRIVFHWEGLESVMFRRLGSIGLK